MLIRIEGRQASRFVTGIVIALVAACGGGGGGTTAGSVGPATGSPSPSPTPTPTPTPVTGYADLTWTAPTQNEDGSSLTNLAGYKVRYGQAASALTQTVDISSPSTTSTRIDGLSSGTWYFTVSSYTNTGVESVPAGPVTKTIL